MSKVIKYSSIFFCNLEWYPKDCKNLYYAAVF